MTMVLTSISLVFHFEICLAWCWGEVIGEEKKENK